MRGRATVSGLVEKVGYLVAMTHEQSDGIMPNNDYRQDAAYAKLNYYAGTSSKIGFTYSYDEGRTESPIPVWPPPGLLG